MAEPTLQQIFGTNATQDATQIIIDKADLTNLTASADNTAESLFAAIILKAANYLTQINQDANEDQSIVIEALTGSITTQNNTNYRQYPYEVTFRKVDTQTTIDPDEL